MKIKFVEQKEKISNFLDMKNGQAFSKQGSICIKTGTRYLDLSTKTLNSMNHSIQIGEIAPSYRLFEIVHIDQLPSRFKSLSVGTTYIGKGTQVELKIGDRHAINHEGKVLNYEKDFDVMIVEAELSIQKVVDNEA